MKLGYLGPRGSFSYLAALAYSPESQKIQLSNFYDVIEGVEVGKIDQAILPIENSTEGAVTPVMDALMNLEQTQIQQELVLKIEHHLLNRTSENKNIQYILSHPQAIEQCRVFIKKHYPRAITIPCESSSSACAIVKEKGNEYAAIANSNGAEIYGLDILHHSIQDNDSNETRFVIIGREKTSASGKDKTSIVFSFHDDYPGSLFTVLKEFEERKINLTKIESRPAKTALGKYFFYIDFEGHVEDIKIRKTLKNVEQLTSKLKILGSYQV